MLKVLFDILSIRYMFHYCYLELECFWILNIRQDAGFNIHFYFCITPVITVICLRHLQVIWLISNVNWLNSFCLIWILRSKCIALALHISYLFYLFICFKLSLLLSTDIIDFIFAVVVVVYSSLLFILL